MLRGRRRPPRNPFWLESDEAGGTGELAFEHVLARDLGRTKQELRTMSHREYVEWQGFYSFEVKYRKHLEDKQRKGR